MSFHKGLFHDLFGGDGNGGREGDDAAATMQLPDVALLGNAGLAAYPSWIPTLQLLSSHKVRAGHSTFGNNAGSTSAASLTMLTLVLLCTHLSTSTRCAGVGRGDRLL